MPVQLNRIGLKDAGVTLKYERDGGWISRSIDAVLVGEDGIFLYRDNPSQTPGDQVRIDWAHPPFSETAFEAAGEVVSVTDEGLEVRFQGGPGTDLARWFKRLRSLVVHEPQYAVAAAKWYGWATIISAGGLLCGAVGLFLPIAWRDYSSAIETLSIFLLAVMILSIGLFAVARGVAMKKERLAIEHGEA